MQICFFYNIVAPYPKFWKNIPYSRVDPFGSCGKLILMNNNCME